MTKQLLATSYTVINISCNVICVIRWFCCEFSIHILHMIIIPKSGRMFSWPKGSWAFLLCWEVSSDLDFHQDAAASACRHKFAAVSLAETSLHGHGLNVIGRANLHGSGHPHIISIALEFSTSSIDALPWWGCLVSVAIVTWSGWAPCPWFCGHSHSGAQDECQGVSWSISSTTIRSLVSSATPEVVVLFKIVCHGQVQYTNYGRQHVVSHTVRQPKITTTNRYVHRNAVFNTSSYNPITVQ